MDAATKKLIKEAVIRSARDPVFFLRFFLIHWFPSPLPAFHLGIIALRTKKVEFLNSYPAAHEFLLKFFVYEPDRRGTESGEGGESATPLRVFYKDPAGNMRMRWKPNLNLIIPRGYSKTTLNKGISIYECLTDNTLFEVFISETATHSETQVNDIKVELETNTKLRAGYGNQVPTKANSEKWTAKELQLRNGAIITSRGRGGQVRGMTFQGRRPNKIVLDDVEDDESVRTEEQRKKTKGWFYAAVVPAGQIMEGSEQEEWAQEPLQIISLGTLLGAECLVLALTSDSEFGTIRFGAVIDEDSQEMLWDYKLSWDSYQKKRQRYRNVGELDKFTREFDSSIRVSEDAIFPEIFIYQPVARKDLIDVAVAMDPAISDSAAADEAAIVASGRERESGALWLLDEWGGRGKSPTKILDAFFAMHKKWQATKAGIEAIAYQASLIHLAKERMAENREFFVVEAITHNTRLSKEARIVGMLSPRYQMGYLKHIRPLPKLESNLADWPDGKRDFADAAAMSLKLLGETAGLRMDGALDNLPSFNTDLPPETHFSIGNYFLQNKFDPVRAGRYG